MPLNSEFSGFCLPLKGASSKDVRQAVSTGKPVVVKFHSPNCGSCAEAAPEIQKAACPHRADVEFLEVNLDQDSEMAEELGIKSIPYVAAYRDGQLVSKKVGAADSEEYGRFIQRALKKKPKPPGTEKGKK